MRGAKRLNYADCTTVWVGAKNLETKDVRFNFYRKKLTLSLQLLLLCPLPTPASLACLLPTLASLVCLHPTPENWLQEIIE